MIEDRICFHKVYIVKVSRCILSPRRLYVTGKLHTKSTTGKPYIKLTKEYITIEGADDMYNWLNYAKDDILTLTEWEEIKE